MAAAPGGFPQLDPESTVKQFREFLSSYNKLSEQCFQDCVNDFTTRKVLDGESSCSTNCLEKYLKLTQRISQRFQEYQMTHSDGGSTMTQMASGGN
ncbi:mitochondrial import inner membrane translocase subunit Tim9-like [Haliotis rufescens]|uniref:mitochondrial import inner membrane translocase subunit Tim9-like n=1 Tax=Haliotis rufescens TaxID=6454 RepID=UPI00201F194C|nr:mitochondrial import inner membrane translocase subunit Tim9-like [Haliotis rufescens]